jgi:hypothetical protein
MNRSGLAPASSMSRARLWLVHGCIAAIVAGSAFDIAVQGEHWPFSSYPMYSGVERSRTLTVVRLFGVVGDGNRQLEFPLTDSDALQPMDQARVAAGLDWIIAISYGDDAKRTDLLTRALSDVLQRYEEHRLAGRHEGPALRGIRMYRVSWQLDPWARNVESPDRKELLFELASPPREGKRGE